MNGKLQELKMEKKKQPKKKPDRSAINRKRHANTTPEQKAASAKKTSESIKRWHREMSAEKKKAIGRKISATKIKRASEIPPRHQRDMNKKKSESFKKFIVTLQGKEQKEYLGYLSSKDILECPPERKARIVKKRNKGHRLYWSKLTPEEKEERINNSVQGENRKRINYFYEKDVPRQKNYCGVVTEQELECI